MSLCMRLSRFFATAGIYYVVPVITKRPLWSEKLANWHFSLSLIGSLLFILPLWIGGFLQGLSWANWATGTSYAAFHKNISTVSFINTIGDMYYWWAMRSFGGLIVLFANFIFAFNIFNTVLLRTYDSNEVKTPKLQPVKIGEPA